MITILIFGAYLSASQTSEESGGGPMPQVETDAPGWAISILGLGNQGSRTSCKIRKSGEIIVQNKS